MAIIALKDITLSFGGTAILDKACLQIEKGERVCLVGRNGAGKSTIMKILAGEAAPDSGEIVRRQGLTTARLEQDVPHELSGTVFETVASGLGAVFSLIAEYHRISSMLGRGNGPDVADLERVHHALEAKGGWQANQRVESAITRLKLPADAQFSTLSGGLKRRALLAKALVAGPELLLLDEPTNHLDIDSIAWLEEFLLGYAGTLLFVTHDRMLIRKLATRIVELERAALTSWPGDYDAYVERKDALMENEARRNALFDKRLTQEEAWVRQGVKARRTRNEGRVRALKEMRAEREKRKEADAPARMRLQDAEASGRLVVEAKGVSFGYGDRTVIDGLTTTILRGDKVGIIGPNGSGKTTLIGLLLGRLAPDRGEVRIGTRLEVSYFDQHRAQLDEEKTVQENIVEGGDTVTINGRPRHVIGYLQDFLFSPDRARTPVRVLSGGERNRLLLARLFARPSNVLVLDEPTNDLDAETLELLEELLLEYQGTLLLVSHDRAFLNNVVTSTLVFENGGLNEYVGGYDDWLWQRKSARSPVETEKKREAAGPDEKRQRRQRLGFKERRELEELPQKIESLEKEQEALYAAMADPAFYQNSKEKVAGAKARLEAVAKELEAAYGRWEELEALDAGG